MADDESDSKTLTESSESVTMTGSMNSEEDDAMNQLIVDDASTSTQKDASTTPPSNDAQNLNDDDDASILKGSCLPGPVFYGPALPDGSVQGPSLPGPVFYGPALPDGTLHYPSPVHDNYEDSFTASSNKDIKDGAAVPGICGLSNLGNTCFMNAGLQCLLTNTALINHFLERLEDDSEVMTLSSKFLCLVNKVWSGQFSCVHPMFFKEMLAVYHPQFRNYRQHDCQEFLALVLDSLHEELNEKNHQRKLAGVGEEIDCNLDDDHSVSPITLPPSEDSNHSNHRLELIPENIVQFKNITSSINAATTVTNSNESENTNSNNDTVDLSVAMVTTTTSLFVETEADSTTSQSSRRPLSLHSIEEYYMKETKTKNINMAATENEEMKTDSEKFSSTGHEDEDVNINSAEFESAAKCSYKNPIVIKDTNLVANRKSKLIDISSNVVLDGATNDGNINNIKRMKVDDELKNVNVKPVLQVNVDTTVMNVGNNLSPTMNAAANNTVAIETPISPSKFRVNQLQPVASCSMADEIERADEKWQTYVEKNQTVVVNTFQGQFKSTVVCSVCQNISVTYEPFMYLSVPLPRAMDKQISVIFMPFGVGRPIRYLVTVSKTDLVLKVKTKLLNLLNSGQSELILAEVFKNHVSRILEDNLLVRYLRDNRSIYAFEMKSDITMTTIFDDDDDASSVTANPPHSPLDWDDSLPSLVDSTDHGHSLVNSTNPEHSLVDSTYPGQSLVDSTYPGQSLVDSTNPGHSLVDSTELYSLNNNDTAVTMVTDDAVSTTTDSTAGATYLPDSTVSHSKPLSIFINNSVSTSSTVAMDTTSALSSKSTNQWSSCAICLEEMIDSELMVHVECGGMLCHSCLQMSVKHYGNSAYVCPVCSTLVDPAVDFVQLSSNKAALKTRLMKISIMTRFDNPSAGDTSLFGHPLMLYLPHISSYTDVYQTVRSALRFDKQFDLLFTDSQGLRCSRCLSTEHCSGCELNDNSEIMFQPNDNLCVRVFALTEDELGVANACDEHQSMSELRPDTPLTLQDCLHAFTESEVLDEQNPWYCSLCRKFQCAKKTMTVWRYPDSLMIYLKRFVFHDFSSTKIDAKVIFPMENLNLEKFISPSAPKENLVYNLHSCVCHFGGVSCGHYTSYCKHPVLNEWHYLNDETITQQRPLDDDYSNAYILFYQRAGTENDVIMPTKSIFEDLDIRERGSPIISAQSSSSMAIVPYQPITEEAINNLLIGLNRNDSEN